MFYRVYESKTLLSDDQTTTSIETKLSILWYKREETLLSEQKLLLAAIIISPHYLRSPFSVTLNLLRMHSFTMWETISRAGECFRTIWTLIRSCPSMLINVKLQNKNKSVISSLLHKTKLVLRTHVIILSIYTLFNNSVSSAEVMSCEIRKYRRKTTKPKLPIKNLKLIWTEE
jgi:hypothetical protein